MKFTKEQKNILKKAYNKNRFTKNLNNVIMNEDIIVLEEKLDKIGYKIDIRPVKRS